MLNNIKLGTKVSAGFIIILLIALFIGIAGYISINSIYKAGNDIAKIRLPGAINLLVISEAQTAVDSAEKTLLLKNLDAEKRKSAYDRFNEAKKGQMMHGRFMNHYLRQTKKHWCGKILSLRGINGGVIMKTL